MEDSATPSNNNDNDPFSKIACDPHHTAWQEGRTHGQDAGRVSGYRAGYDIGTATALEHGLEIGFVQGILEALPKDNDKGKSTRTHLERILQDLPPPQVLIDGSNNKNNDVTTLFQTIRGRFKLLCVQLGHAKFSLSDLLSSRDDGNDGDPPPPMAEW